MTATEIVLYVMLFIGILVLVEGLYLTMFGRSIAFNTRLNKRFSNLNRNHKRDAVMAQLRKDVSQKHTRANVPLMTHLADLAQKAGLAVTPQRLTTYMVLTATVLTLVLTFSTPLGILISLPIGVLAGFGGIYAWLSGAAHKRMNTMEEQLPDAVELMVRSLRVGHPFSATLAIVAAEMAEPLATEFSTISDEAVYGRDIPDALQDLATRLDLQDLRFLAVAISIQQQSGGNLSEILAGLAQVIRARFRLFRRVKAITAEAKWSGMFLSAFPIVALVGISIFRPGYYADIQAEGWFAPAILIVIAFMIANIAVMRLLVNVKV